MENKIVLVPDPEDFLKIMEELQEAYNNKNTEEGVVNYWLRF